MLSVPSHSGLLLSQARKNKGFRGLNSTLVLPYILGVMFFPFLFFHSQLFPLLSANKTTLLEGNGEKALVSSFLFFSLVHQGELGNRTLERQQNRGETRA